MFLKKISRVVIWPKAKTLNFYFSRSDDNLIPFDINLWQPLSDLDIARISQFLKQNHISSATVLVNDDVVFTRSFIYDQAVTQVDRQEVITLAKDIVNFDIDPQSVTYQIVPSGDKTLIKTQIFNHQKFSPLFDNLQKLNIKLDFQTISESLSSTLFKFYPNPFFVFYPLESETDYLVALCHQQKVYLTAIVKKSLPDIKKIINYSQAYFGSTAKKVFLPETIAGNFDVPEVEKTTYQESQLAIDLKLPGNLPLPVAGIIGVTMENKKNLLPVIAVFIITAALAAFIVWLVIGRNSSNTDVQIPATDLVTPVEVTQEPTPTPTVAVVEPAKTIKLQVLNATDISGQAATIKEKLVKLGFSSVNIGNATEKATSNEIRLKPSLATSSAYFTSKVAGFETATITELKDASTYDAVFIIGVDLSKQ